MEQILGVEVLSILAILTFYILSAEFLEMKKFPIHESALAIILGLVMGYIFYFSLDKTFPYNDGFFFYFILPPIIFAAGYTLKTKLFFMNFGYITIFGFIGTFLSFLTISGLTYFFANNGALDKPLKGQECLLIASILSATDTVAAVSMVKESKYPILNSLLFGEGVVNDAAAIILFKITQNLLEEDNVKQFDFSFNGLLYITAYFFYITITSIVIGVTFALIAAWILKKTPQMRENPSREVAIVILIAYISYVLAELLELSGVMTIFSCGIVMARYVWYNISEQSRNSTSISFHVIAQTAEAFTFTYVGLSVPDLAKDSVNLLFILCMMFTIIIGRAVSIFIPQIFLFFCSKALDGRELCVIWYCGIIRGAIAFALVLQLSGQNQEMLKVTVMGIVLFSTIFFSSFLPLFTNWIGLDEEVNTEAALLNSSSKNAYIQDQSPKKFSKSKLNDCFINWEKNYLQPIFGGHSWEKNQHQNTQETQSAEDQTYGGVELGLFSKLIKNQSDEQNQAEVVSRGKKSISNIQEAFVNDNKRLNDR